MADTGIFCTTTEVQRKVGANASATSNTEAYINDFVTQAESEINAATRYNWSDKYSTLNADVKGILKEAASNLAAIYVLSYDFVAIITAASNIAAEDRINILRDGYLRCLSILREIKTQTFMIGA